MPDRSADVSQPSRRGVMLYTEVVGSPFTLATAWAKVATVGEDTRALTIDALADASAFDIEITFVPVGAAAPAVGKRGAAVLAGYDGGWGDRLERGDVYLRSIGGGQVAIVKTGA